MKLKRSISLLLLAVYLFATAGTALASLTCKCVAMKARTEHACCCHCLHVADLAVENALVDQVIESMEGEIPQAMYDARMDEMVNDFAFRVEQQGLRLEDYLKYMGQTMEQFRASFMPQAEKQVKIRLEIGRAHV